MTENVGDSGLRFEIWFRRRKTQDTFILQASSAEVKAVWTAIIGKILWRQALRNRGDFHCYFDVDISATLRLLILYKTFVLSLKYYISEFQRCACRRWFPWGLEASLSWTSSRAMQRSVTEPSTIS